MYKSKPVILLQTFTKKELRLCLQFVETPLYNRNEQVLQLYKLLITFHPTYDQAAIDRQELFSLLFPNTPYNEQRLRYVMSDLTKVLEAFITQQEYQQEKNYFLARAYAKRNLSKYFDQTYKQIQTKWKKENIKGRDFYLQKYVLEDLKLRAGLQKKVDLLPFTQSIIYELDSLYLVHKLHYICEVINYTYVYADKKTPNDYRFLLAAIQDALPDSKYINEPAILIYYQILLNLTEFEEEAHFHQLLALLRKYESYFEPSELNTMYTFATNYCVRQMNRGNDSYFRHLFELYKHLLDKEIMLYADRLTESDYKNIATLSLKFNELEYAAHFIETYQTYIEKTKRENAYTFNLAHLRFYQQQFNDTLALINQVEFTDPYYHADSKLLIMMSYYELDELVPLHNTFDTFGAFLRRNKLASAVHRKMYLNYLKYIKQLTRIRLGNERYIKSLQEEISGKPESMYMKWIRNQLDTLIK